MVQASELQLKLKKILLIIFSLFALKQINCSQALAVVTGAATSKYTFFFLWKDECSLQDAGEAGICSPGGTPAAKDGQWPWQAVLLLHRAQQGEFPFGGSSALSS